MGTTVTMCDIEERIQQLEIKSQNGQTKMEKEFKVSEHLSFLRDCSLEYFIFLDARDIITLVK